MLMPMAVLLALQALAAPPLPSPPVRFTGVCDASAAIVLNRELWVFNDEDQATTKLRVYALAGGAPLRELPIDSSRLQLDVKEPEIDIEGAAVIGNRIYVMGSHSRSRKARLRVSRQRLFALPWPPAPKLAPGGAYTTWLADAQKRIDSAGQPPWTGLKLDNGDAPSAMGVSIEGLAASPGGGLVFGFRSPLADKKAILIELLNPAAAIAGSPAQLGPPQAVDLKDHGVRDLLWDRARACYWILSGPPLDDGTFGLYRWNPGKPPVEVVRSRLTAWKIDRDASAEALAWEDDGKTLWILFDEGDVKVGGTECKDSTSPRFHGVRLTGL